MSQQLETKLEESVQESSPTCQLSSNTQAFENTGVLNHELATHVIETALSIGVREFCLSPGKRNAPLVYALSRQPGIRVYYWPEERSSAFFALGRIKANGRPIAVVTTSGTAVGELLPAAMEAHYTGLPLLLMTADRPRHYRGTGAPQTAEQVGLFGCYAHFEQDVTAGEKCDLTPWTCQGPAHLNVCFEEPCEEDCRLTKVGQMPTGELFRTKMPLVCEKDLQQLEEFFKHVRHPLVVVGSLPASAHEAIVPFLLELQAPIYAEGISGIREDLRLECLKIRRIDQVWQIAKSHGYPIDGILRIGGIPTARLWRDLEDLEGQVRVCSVSEQPFAGLSWGQFIHTSLNAFCQLVRPERWAIDKRYYQKWKESDQQFHEKLLHLFIEEPQAEPSLIHQLSATIPKQAQVFLGNSMPIREWDLAATYEERKYRMEASRGLSGIDGQISTFLGFSQPNQCNVALIGDLTAVYDLAGPWILPQIPDIKVQIVIVNNHGGKIFARMFSNTHFLNEHDLNFKPLADLWHLSYDKWTGGHPLKWDASCNRLIEVEPDDQATQRFWKKVSQL